MSKFQSPRRRYSETIDTGDYDPLPSGERSHLIAATVNGIGRRPRRLRRAGAEDTLEFLADHPELFGNVELDWTIEATSQQRDVKLCQELARITARSPKPRPTALDRRIAWLARLIGLSALDGAILAVMLRRRLWPLWMTMCERALDQRSMWLGAGQIGALLGVSAHAVRQRLQRHSPLLLAGMIENHGDDDFYASAFLLRLGKMRSTNANRLAAAMLQPEPRSSLQWDDFAHLQVERDVAAGLIAAAAKQREGVNLLLHGMPGTGKTEFARALADRLGLEAIFIGKTDSLGGEPVRSERIAHLTLVRALTRRSRRYLIVIDEAEDLMLIPQGRERTQGSKLWLNQLVEGSLGPTIWIANDLMMLGDPVIRRMSGAIAFTMPPPVVREQILARHAAASAVPLSASERRRLAILAIPPAVAASAVRAAAMTDGKVSTIESVAAGLAEALGAPMSSSYTSLTQFDPALSRADVDIELLASRLATSSERAWSMLLEGISGTGKSAYARHLAERLGLELIERRGSDLLGSFVGETERLIARAFSEAARRGALLLLDEADALLRDRRGAQRGWEVSMTNEMLAWMDRHPAPFIVTTNLADTLDRATLRRFLFRIRFQTLDAERAALLWSRHFGDAAPPGLARIAGLTPSDFANIARRIAISGEADAPHRLRLLNSEASSKGYGTTGIGFLAA